MVDIISPNELVLTSAKEVPDVIFEVINELIKEKWDCGTVFVEFNEICEDVYKNGGSKDDMYAFVKNVHKVRDVFRIHGWGVEYFDTVKSFKFFMP